MSNLILKTTNSYYFKSDAISVYPCAYRGADDSGKYFNPASRYTSEKNLTGAVVGLVPNGTYVSYIPIPEGKSDTWKDTWKFTIGGYNFEAKIDAATLGELMKVGDGKAVMFEIDPDEPSELAGLGAILTSFEDPTNAGVGALDQILPGGPYCFTGLKVTVLTTITEDTPIQPTPTKLIPVLYKSEGDATALVLNQCARLPEIIHGDEEGEIEVAKLTVDEAIVENTDTKNLLVENQLIVGTDDANILIVAQNNNNPIIEVKQAPVIINTSTDTEETKALSVAGGAEIKQSLTVTGNTTAGTLSAATGKFVVNNDGSTIIKNDLTVKDANENDKFKVDIDGKTTIVGELHVGPTTPYLSVADGNTEVNTTNFKVKNIEVRGTTNSTGSTSGALQVKGGVGITKNLNVGGNFSTKTTSITGDLTVKDSGDNTKFEVKDTKTTVATTTTEITGNSTVKGTLEVAGDLNINLDTTKTPNTSKFKVEAETGNTTIAGELAAAKGVYVNTDRFSTDVDGNTSIAGTLGVAKDFTINTDKFGVTAETGNTAIDGTLSVAGDSVTLVGDTVKIEKSVDPEVQSIAINGTTQINKSLVVTGDDPAGSKAVSITAGGLLVAGDIVSESALIVDEAATAQALNIKPGAAAQAVTVIDSNRNLQNINAATVGELYIKSSENTTNSELASLNNKGELTAKSVQANILKVPETDKEGNEVFTAFSLKPGEDVEVTNADNLTITVPTKVFCFGNEEYVATPTIAKQGLFDLIYPIGSIYMTMAEGNPTKLFGGTWTQISKGRVLIGQGSGTDANSKTVNFNVGGTGNGYYNPQPWAHWHKYSKANYVTEATALSMEQMPRHTHTAKTKEAGAHIHSLELTGTIGDKAAGKNNCVRLAHTDKNGQQTLSAWGGKGSGIQIYSCLNHTHTVTANLTGGDTSSELAGSGKGHTHDISLTKDTTPTTGYYTNSTATASGGTQSNGNLPPYLVCYIWERTA